MSSTLQNFAHLRDGSPLLSIFPTGMVPILNILVPHVAALEGEGIKEVYMIDLDKLSPTQIDKIICKLQAASNGLSGAIILKEIRANGLPLRAHHVAATSSNCLAFL